MKLDFLGPRLTLIVAGIALGLLARWVLGVPEPENPDRREIDRALPAAEETEFNLPLIRDGDSNRNNGDDQGGLVPPLSLEYTVAAAPHADPGALFEAHGHQWCASGCAASRHPTPYLRRAEYRELIQQYRDGPMTADNEALEALLFFGSQTRRWLDEEGVGDLDRSRESFLRHQLLTQRAIVEMRLVDQQGRVRSWLPATGVPLDRRHVFDMQTSDLQPLVTSGTVKRVGLGHVWVRM